MAPIAAQRDATDAVAARRLIRRGLARSQPPARLVAAAWPIAALLVIAVAVALLAASSSWQALDSGLRSLDFDPERALLLEAWTAGLLFATAGALATGRPWWSSLSAAGFVGFTYVLPLGTRLVQQAPILFGTRQRVVIGTIQHNQLVALAVAFLVAIVGAAVGDLVGRELRKHWTSRGSRASRIGSGGLAGLVLVALVLASGVDPLLRIGPAAGAYAPGQLPVRVLATGGKALQPERVPTSGEVRHMTYRSQIMAEDRHFIIYLPPTYGLASAALRRYPSLYLLHGDPSGPDEWLNYGTPALFDAGFARGDLPETIVVMPDGNGHVTAATQWANRRDGRDRIEDATLELVAYIDQTFRTAAQHEYRVVAGLSSGAYGAVNMAAGHPDVFGVAMGFSGYYFARGPVFGSDRAYADRNSPTVILAQSPAARSVHYVLTVGDNDGYRSYGERFAQELRRLGVQTDFAIIPGGHGGQTYWQGLIFGMGVIKSQLGALPSSDGGPIGR